MNAMNSVLESYNAQSTIGDNLSFFHMDEYNDWSGSGKRFQHFDTDSGGSGSSNNNGDNNDNGGCIGTAVSCGICACIALNADTFCSCLCDNLLGNLLDAACGCCG